MPILSSSGCPKILFFNIASWSWKPSFSGGMRDTVRMWWGSSLASLRAVQSTSTAKHHMTKSLKFGSKFVINEKHWIKNFVCGLNRYEEIFSFWSHQSNGASCFRCNWQAWPAMIYWVVMGCWFFGRIWFIIFQLIRQEGDLKYQLVWCFWDGLWHNIS